MSTPIVLNPVCQLTDSHCGPAVLEVLLSFWGVSVTQDRVVEAARVKSRLEKYGMRPDQLATAVAKLAPDYQILFKQGATGEDLSILIREYGIPVGINWQGMFYDTLEEEAADWPGENIYGDHGHYSMVVGIDVYQDTILIADTYSEYFQQPRSFSLSWFESRWWDANVKRDRKSGQKLLQRTQQMIFVVIPKSMSLPEKLGLELPAHLPGFYAMVNEVDSDTLSQLKSHR